MWRLIAGVAVFACFLGVIAALAPVYIDNLRLGSYIRALAAAPDAAVAPDDKLRAEVLDRAGQLGLPVQPNDVQITHPGGKMKICRLNIVCRRTSRSIRSIFTSTPRQPAGNQIAIPAILMNI